MPFVWMHTVHCAVAFVALKIYFPEMAHRAEQKTDPTDCVCVCVCAENEMQCQQQGQHHYQFDLIYSWLGHFCDTTTIKIEYKNEKSKKMCRAEQRGRGKERER